jgi:hypothetical protein
MEQQRGRMDGEPELIDLPQGRANRLAPLIQAGILAAAAESDPAWMKKARQKQPCQRSLVSSRYVNRDPSLSTGFHLPNDTPASGRNGRRAMV